MPYYFIKAFETAVCGHEKQSVDQVQDHELLK